MPDSTLPEGGAWGDVGHSACPVSPRREASCHVSPVAQTLHSSSAHQARHVRARAMGQEQLRDGALPIQSSICCWDEGAGGGGDSGKDAGPLPIASQHQSNDLSVSGTWPRGGLWAPAKGADTRLFPRGGCLVPFLPGLGWVGLYPPLPPIPQLPTLEPLGLVGSATCHPTECPVTMETGMRFSGASWRFCVGRSWEARGPAAGS